MFAILRPEGCARLPVTTLAHTHPDPIVLKIEARLTTLGRIKTELMDEAAARPVLLLGAGASIKSGVPSAAGFAEMIARWAYLRDQGRSEHDQSVHRSDWLPWLKTLSAFK